jgi:hypothetical protein
MPGTLARRQDVPRRSALPAQPYGLSLHADRRDHARLMSRLTSDLSPGTYVVNPDTSLSVA